MSFCVVVLCLSLYILEARRNLRDSCSINHHITIVVVVAAIFKPGWAHLILQQSALNIRAQMSYSEPLLLEGILARPAQWC